MYMILLGKRYSIFLLGLISWVSYGQVGIGTASPTAMLEVSTEQTGIPAVGLTPQTNPLGEDSGQLAAIGDKLFMYNSDKNKWLSIEATTLEFGRLGWGSVPREIEFGGGDVQTGAKMPFDGTIVSISYEARTVNNDRNIYLLINDVPVLNNDVNQNLDGVFDLLTNQLTYVNNSYNVDFDEGDVVKFEVDENVASSDVIDLILVAQIKWRKDNN